MLCPLCLAIVVHFSQKIAFLSHLLSHKDYFIEEIFFFINGIPFLFSGAFLTLLYIYRQGIAHNTKSLRGKPAN